MKVFLSWSGTQSHKVALVFRDWLPSVIQEIVPYVSSEDIDKGARWSTDIAKELADSKFGLLCVTRENVSAPWLMFEAGALSKTMDKSFVSPFLFDIKRSELDGPILQFQSTIFEKEDLKKLITTLNKACDKEGLTDERLSKAFEVWYPTLQEALEQLREDQPAEQDNDGLVELQTPKTQEILEEILDLSRSNQKLIRNPDGALGSNLEEINMHLLRLLESTKRRRGPRIKQRIQRRQVMILDMLLSESEHMVDGYIGAQMAFGVLRSRYPWLYDIGSETISILKSRKRIDEKHRALDQLQQVIRFSTEHPVMREEFGDHDELRYFLRKVYDMLFDAFNRKRNSH